MKILCTICARKGSKGVKNKNITKIYGKPLIAYTIEQAKKANIFNKIVLSTDSRPIQKIGKKFGAESWFLRKPSLSSDNISKVSVIKDIFLKSEEKFNRKFDLIVDLDITSPLRNVSDIIKATRLFKKKKLEILFSVCKSKKNPYFNIVEYKNNKISLVKSQKKQIYSRQKAKQTFDANASIYIWSRKALLNFSTFFKKKTGVFLMPDERSWDIDSYFDLKIVKLLLKKKYG